MERLKLRRRLYERSDNDEEQILTSESFDSRILHESWFSLNPGSLNVKTDCIIPLKVVHTWALWCGGALTVVRPQFCLSCRQKVIFARKTAPSRAHLAKEI